MKKSLIVIAFIVSLFSSAIGTALADTDPDTTGPAIGYIISLSNTSVQIVYNEPVDQTTAEDVQNYAITGIFGSPQLAVTSATLVNPTTVVLTTASQSTATLYLVTVTNVTDTSGNVIQSGYNSRAFAGQ